MMRFKLKSRRSPHKKSIRFILASPVVLGLGLVLILLLALPMRHHPVLAQEGEGDLTPEEVDLETARLTPVFVSSEYQSNQSVAWGDMDGDGDLDLAVGTGGAFGNQNQIFRNEGGNQFTILDLGTNSQTTTSVAWGDLEGDGDLDLAVGNAGAVNQIYRNNGNGSFTTFSLGVNARDTTSIAWGDMDGDGDLDIAAGNENQINQLYKNNGDGTFSETNLGSDTLHTTSLAWGDANGDGDLDIVVGNYEAVNQIYSNNGSGVFSASNLGAISRYTQAVVWADMDLDGDLDIVVGNSGMDDSANSCSHIPGFCYLSEHDQIYTNNGTGSFTPADFSSTEEATLSLAVGDMDGDGDLDIATGNYGSKVLYVNEGGGVYTREALDVDRPLSYSVAWGDMDGDGDLDLAIGNYNLLVQVYRNNNPGSFTLTDLETFSYNTKAMAWGDADGDGDLDLAVGNRNDPNQLYRNNGDGTFSIETILNESLDTTSMAWGDADGDGDLDLAVGNHGGENRIRLNAGDGTFPYYWPITLQGTTSMAWGDIDGDGDLDLVAGTEYDTNRIYRNVNSGSYFSPEYLDYLPRSTTSIALGDADGDGDLDIAAGNDYSANLLYRNDGNGYFTPEEIGPEEDLTTSVAWGDADGDGDLDLAVGNTLSVNRLYTNNGSGVFTGQTMVFDIKNTESVAWGDADGDGDLDLGVANSNLTVNQIYTNEGEGIFTPNDIMTATAWSYSVAWGDADGDGDLDLAVGNLSSNQLATNHRQGDRGLLNTPPLINVLSPGSLENAGFFAMANILEDPIIPISYTLKDLGLDYAGRVEVFYSLDGGGNWLPAVQAEPTNNVHLSTSFPGNYASKDPFPLSIYTDTWKTSWLYVPDNQIMTDVDVWLNINHTWDAHVDIWIQSPQGIYSHLLNNVGSGGDNFLGTILDDEAAIYVADGTPPFIGRFQPVGISSVYPLSNFDGLSSKGNWYLWYRDLEPLYDDGELLSWGINIKTSENGQHVFYWDTFASGFFGQSDNVVLRFEVYPQPAQAAAAGTYLYTNRAAGPYMVPFVASTTFPFRVRGTQVQVLDTNNQPLENAQVYRLLKGATTGAFLMPEADKPLRTNATGFLQGRGDIVIGDQLMAVIPVTSTAKYTHYHTSAAPSPTGLNMYTVSKPGVQPLIISNSNSLLVFDLDISLEWDARNDPAFLADLESSLEQASAVLYDVTNGQVALGDITIYHNKQNWLSSDIVMYARNNIRPRANQGGVVEEPTNDVGLGGVIQDAFLPGQISIGPIWDPFGENQFDFGQDWWRTLAHELAHFLLFLPDNYIGVNQTGLVGLDCQGSFMTNTYDENYSELLTRPEWETDADCMQSVAEQITGRADWETVTYFYNMLTGASGNPGPSNLPLDLVQVTFVDPVPVPLALTTRNYDIRDASTGQIALAPLAQGYLIHTQGTPNTLNDDTLVNLGSTRAGGDRIKVRGAEPGDRVCVFDLQNTTPRLGCENVQSTSTAVFLTGTPNWQPEIQVTPVSSTTLDITVNLAQAANQLRVQVYPATGDPDNPNAPINAPTANMTTSDNLTFQKRVTLPFPAFSGYIRVWRPSVTPEQMAITEYALDTSAWGGNIRAWSGGNIRAWSGGNIRAWSGAPTVSSDGQLTILNLDDPYADNGVSALQIIGTTPGLPNWLTPVGQAYQVIIKDGFPANTPRSLSFDYLQRDVPDGHEADLSIYYYPDGGNGWQRLTTTLDLDENRAVTKLPSGGEGIYILIATVKLPAFSTGWNNFGYPIDETRPVAEALASINGKYTSVYYYNTATDTWLLYDATVIKDHAFYAPLVNTLSNLNFGRGYWLYATQNTTGYLGIETRAPALPPPDQIPAAYYGPLAASSGFTPQAGMVVEAYVGDAVCGSGMVLNYNNRLVFSLLVRSDAAPGCDTPNATLTFRVAGRAMTPQPTWDNSQAHFVTLTADKLKLFLPAINR